ncbi:MAG: serine protease [Gemmataceae bacterium]
MKYPRTLLCFLTMGLVWIVGISQANASNEVYRKVVAGTVGFTTPTGQVGGSGIVIDSKKRLVLTAFHVVNGLATKNNKLHLVFPIWRNGRVVTSTFEYARAFQTHREKISIQGEVVAYNPLKDLALVKASKLPPQARAIPLASSPPEPGDSIHVVGNSTATRGGLFGYSQGFVRNSFSFAKGGFFYYALCHQTPSNKGDSGGPVVNDDGEIVGMISQGTTGFLDVEQVVDYSVHLKEIRAFLDGKRTYKTPAELPVASLELSGTAIRDRQSDVIRIEVEKNEKLEIRLRGSQTSDLDLVVNNGFNRIPAVSLTSSERDTETVGLKFSKSGYCRIAIPNFYTPRQKERIANKNLKVAPRTTSPNPYRLLVRSQNTSPRSVLIVRTIAPKTTDKVSFQYPVGNKKARVSIIGDGRADLDLLVRNSNGRVVTKSDTFGSHETVTWTPQGTGKYTIEVSHQGPDRLQSVYSLVTD